MRYVDLLPLVAAGVLAMPAAARAHAGEWHGPSLLTAWNFAPEVMLSLALVTLLYARGVRRQRVAGYPVPPVQQWGMLAGLLAIALALVSPLDPLADQLASAHMVQHLLLIAVAPPLLAQGTPVRTMFWGLPQVTRRAAGQVLRRLARSGGVLRGPITAASVHAIVIWGWHAPALYAAALADPVVHALDHASLLISGLLLWHAVLARRPGEEGFGLGMLALLVTTIHTGMLGALMTFSGHPWYPELLGRTESWGLTPLEDQQLAGLIMWVPMGFVYVIAAVILGSAWFAFLDRRSQAMRLTRTAGR
jgi:putative membrane protein